VGHGPFALQDVDVNGRLAVFGRAKRFRLAVGMVVLRGMSVVITLPSVSSPRLNGVTSSSSTSLTPPPSTPA
jgi:hypothetical protein